MAEGQDGRTWRWVKTARGRGATRRRLRVDKAYSMGKKEKKGRKEEEKKKKERRKKKEERERNCPTGELNPERAWDLTSQMTLNQILY